GRRARRAGGALFLSRGDGLSLHRDQLRLRRRQQRLHLHQRRARAAGGLSAVPTAKAASSDKRGGGFSVPSKRPSSRFGRALVLARAKKAHGADILAPEFPERRLHPFAARRPVVVEWGDVEDALPVLFLVGDLFFV